MKFDATVETRPAAIVKDFEGLEVKRPDDEVSDEDVDAQVQRFRVQTAPLEDHSRPLRDGDFALIDIRTYQHDETIEDATGKDLLIEVGAEMIVPELDNELRGASAGAILKFTCELPERFGENAGRQVGMQVLVKQGKARNLPEIDDELAKKISEFETLDGLKQDIRSQMQRVRTTLADSELKQRVLDAFVENSVEVAIPEGMLELEVDRLLDGMSKSLEARGASLAKYLDHENIDLTAARHRLKDQAERNIKLELGLKMVGELTNVTVSDDERTEQARAIAKKLDKEPGEVIAAIEDRGDWSSVDGDIIANKALDFLVEHAKITKEEPNEAE